MYEVACLDKDGNTVDHLTQWDVGQKYIVEVDGVSSMKAPEVHFANENSVEAMKVNSIISSGRIVANIPNELLQFAKPIYAYIYLTDSSSASSKKTIAITKLPVRKKPKPINYHIQDVISQSQYNFLVKEFDGAVTDVNNMKAELVELNTVLSSLPEVATVDEVSAYLGI